MNTGYQQQMLNKAIDPRQLNRTCATTAFQSPPRPEAGSFPHVIDTSLPERPQSTRFGWYHYIRYHEAQEAKRRVSRSFLALELACGIDQTHSAVKPLHRS
ncbi:hypothetical protein CY34DRAFT_684866 [Suillus luteus UH-Slu-Lm8-n1]|uniref:Unplaced genomic scaffold CY34scaffold_74, whole genome shotgun sequence n=1 Tax=Suillus luteus UH-Slu-Lm8-n1 TaxID=930992 RepID=A0A0D0A1B8_9AGAM|nr:hypothetical protein CY34DRAFT_684866 [Suillus luteus UH-Slu-Lm8-n1]